MTTEPTTLLAFIVVLTTIGALAALGASFISAIIYQLHLFRYNQDRDRTDEGSSGKPPEEHG